MLSVQALDENCLRLIQIFKCLKKYFYDFYDVERFLDIKAIVEKDFNINYKLPRYVCCNETQYSGNTALHFLANSNDYQCLNLFIEHGADLTIQNDNGCTPLLLAFQKGSKFNDLLLIYFKNKIFTNLKDKNGLSHFHVACSTNHTEAVDSFLIAGSSVDERVNNDSPKYAGFTPLHFAALHEQFQTIELLIAVGANINSKDANGITPLHLLIKKSKETSFDRKFFVKIISLIDLPDYVGLTKLHITCIVNYVSILKKNLNQDINVDSPIKFDSPTWPGYTPLHVASQFNISAVMCLLEKGANLLAKDGTGTSALDLCSKQFSLHDIIQILLTEKRHNLFQTKFTDGTSLLDVLHAMKNNNEFQQFIKAKIKNINTVIPPSSLIWPGYNLLHLAVMFDQDENILVSALLSFNVNFTMLNENNMSPLHLAFYFEKKEMVDIILDHHEKISVNPVDRDNLSHLHIACAAQNSKAVQQLLRNGSDPNLPLLKDIHCNFFKSYTYKTGSTPFEIAIGWIDENLIDEIPPTPTDNLDESDDNPSLSSHHGPITYNLENKQYEKIISCMLKPEVKAVMTRKMIFKILNRIFFYSYRHNSSYTKIVNKLVDEMQFKELGLTKLEVACALDNLIIVKEELKSGVDVNHQIALDSDIWPGDTALHLNSRKELSNYHRSISEITHLLIAHGANPNIKNASNLTPVHLTRFSDLREEMLLACEKFPFENPTNNDGLSHFHLSCTTKNFHLVEKFVKSGVNVNTPVNYFAESYASCTPLHCTIPFSTKEIFELLLSNGADPNIKTCDGRTLFYSGVSNNIDQDRLELILRSSTADIQSTDIIGNPPLMKALEIFRMFMYVKDPEFSERMTNLVCNFGVHMDFANLSTRELYYFIQTAPYLSTPTFQLLLNSISNITDVDGQGNNILHYVQPNRHENVLYYFNKFFSSNLNMLVQSECDINHKNNEGKTPLHTAVDEDNAGTISLLLSLGADVNIKDDKKKTPLFYAHVKSRDSYSDVEIKLIIHIKDLKQDGLFVDESNEDIFITAEAELAVDRERNLKKRAEKRKLDNKLKKEINPSFSVDYFFTEEFEINYKRMSIFQRQAIRNICESDNLSQEFPELQNLIRLQFRKAQSRTRLIQPAITVFQTLVNTAMPVLCLDLILKYLNNDDLMNMVRSGYGKLVFAPLRDNY